jgi:hypothetical protein
MQLKNSIFLKLLMLITMDKFQKINLQFANKIVKS